MIFFPRKLRPTANDGKTKASGHAVLLNMFKHEFLLKPLPQPQLLQGTASPIRPISDACQLKLASSSEIS